MGKKRAMTSEKASYVKRQGHKDAKEFANAIGLPDDYQNDSKAKKDVIDLSGDAYSVKSGQKKWQIFLYSKSRFSGKDADVAFLTLNGIGQLLLECIGCFPEERSTYLQDKIKHKDMLKVPMIELCKRLQDKVRLAAFIDKGMFNGGEVNYLAIKQDNIFHVYWGKEVTKLLAKNLTVENSKAKQINQVDYQKVVFKLSGGTIGEIEMRNDSSVHYRQVKFWLDKRIIVPFLLEQISKNNQYNNKVIVYGEAIKKFGKW